MVGGGRGMVRVGSMLVSERQVVCSSQVQGFEGMETNSLSLLQVWTKRGVRTGLREGFVSSIWGRLKQVYRCRRHKRCG